FADFLIPRAERAEGEVFPADLPELQARRPDRPLEVGDLEVDHFMAPRLEPPPQGRERIVVTRRGETQDADTTHGSALRSWQPLCPCSRTAPHELRFVHACLSFSRLFVWDTSKCGPGESARAFGAATSTRPAHGEWYGGRSVASWRGLLRVRRFLRASRTAPASRRGRSERPQESPNRPQFPPRNSR